MAKVHLSIGFMVEHEGIIEKIDDQRIIVRILQQSACSDCHAKGMCMAADSKEKRIEVTDTTKQFCEKERVIIEGETSIGYKAVFWAFIVPLIFVILTLILSLSYDADEILAAILALMSLLPYYLLLYLLRNKMAYSFRFKIKKRADNI